jgi:hypothetical protein
MELGMRSILCPKYIARLPSLSSQNFVAKATSVSSPFGIIWIMGKLDPSILG